MERNEGIYLLHGTLLFLHIALILREEVSEKRVFQKLKDAGLFKALLHTHHTC